MNKSVAQIREKFPAHVMGELIRKIRHAGLTSPEMQFNKQTYALRVILFNQENVPRHYDLELEAPFEEFCKSLSTTQGILGVPPKAAVANASRIVTDFVAEFMGKALREFKDPVEHPVDLTLVPGRPAPQDGEYTLWSDNRQVCLVEWNQATEEDGKPGKILAFQVRLKKGQELPRGPWKGFYWKLAPVAASNILDVEMGE